MTVTAAPGDAPARPAPPDPGDAAYLDVRGVAKSFRGTEVLKALDIAIGRGEFVSLLGPSGCGKTTLLRLVAGLLRADRGTIRLGGNDLTALPPHRRNVGVVFQNYALFPHLDVFGNIAFGLKSRGTPAAEVEAIVDRFLALVHLSEFRHRPASALSGGQQQRVAVARALAVHPDILLLDEPFSALDRKLRETMQIELRSLLRELGITAVFVTHDQDEALIMSDRVAVMNAGRIEQFADPVQVYAKPATTFVLDFIGSSSRIDGTVSRAAAGTLEIDTVAGPVRAPGNFIRGARVKVALRPEDVAFGPAPETGDTCNTFVARLADRIYMGSKTVVHLAAGDSGHRIIAEVPPETAADLKTGGALTIHWPVARTMVFPEGE